MNRIIPALAMMFGTLSQFSIAQDLPELGMPATLTGAPTSATFFLGASNDDFETYTNQFPDNFGLSVQGAIHPEPAHIGSPGSLLVLASINNVSFSLGQNGYWSVWDGEVDSLIFSRLDALPEVADAEFDSLLNMVFHDDIQVDVASGLQITLYLGYATDLVGGEVYYSGEPYIFSLDTAWEVSELAFQEFVDAAHPGYKPVTGDPPVGENALSVTFRSVFPVNTLELELVPIEAGEAIPQIMYLNPESEAPFNEWVGWVDIPAWAFNIELHGLHDAGKQSYFLSEPLYPSPIDIRFSELFSMLPEGDNSLTLQVSNAGPGADFRINIEEPDNGFVFFESTTAYINSDETLDIDLLVSIPQESDAAKFILQVEVENLSNGTQTTLQDFELFVDDSPGASADLQYFVDIIPGQCTNPIAIDDTSVVIQVVIPGSADAPVSQLDATGILMGGEYTPQDISYADLISHPADNCAEAVQDNFEDLVLEYQVGEIFEPYGGSVEEGDTLVIYFLIPDQNGDSFLASGAISIVDQ